jgi:hypothetical protein
VYTHCPAARVGAVGTEMLTRRAGKSRCWTGFSLRSLSGASSFPTFIFKFTFMFTLTLLTCQKQLGTSLPLRIANAKQMRSTNEQQSNTELQSLRYNVAEV